ncbi:MAG: aspartate kinase [Ruminococcaceae bacterium]|nr:aspartate kinase [Oscillospiraceae bacterium]
MGIIVQKFGGSSVANAEKIFNVAGRIQDAYDEGNSVVVVVSAQGDTTDDLIEKAAEINEKPSKREMDVLLSTGEQITIALLAMALEKNKYPVVSLTGWQTPIKTNMVYGSARIEKVETTRLVNELDKGRIVIVAGFQGVNNVNDITTLGRGGSDTTAVALAAALRADVCEIYTDVDGVYTCDPRIVPDARKLNDISYDEMLELASLGANVLHNRSVEMAKKYHVDLEVKSSFQKVAGTKVKEAGSVEKLLVRGVARDNDVARIAVIGVDDTPGKAYRMFALLAKKNINVDVILQSIGRDDSKDISFTVSRSQMEEAIKVLNDNLEDIGAKAITHDEKISKVSIVGSGMLSNPGVAARMFEALYDANINIRMISTSEIKVSVLIDEDMAEKAVQAIHHKFFKD